DAVFARDGAAPGQDLAEELIQGAVGATDGLRLAVVHHDVDVNVAVASMAEAGNGKVVRFTQDRRKAEQILQTAAGDDDVLVQLGQAGVAQGVGKLAAEVPELFALLA